MPHEMKKELAREFREIEERIPAPIVLADLALAFALGAALLLHTPAPLPAHSASLFNPLQFAEISTTSEPLDFPISSSPTTLNVPILVYHIVRPSYPDDSNEVRAFAQTPEVFDAQLAHLADAGYHLISFTELENALRYNAPLPTKPLILSFDDGWRDQFEYAFPILEKHHMHATFFVFTNSIGKRSFLSWDNLRTLLNAGMTIGSHSRSHPYLTRITDPAVLTDEIVGSKKILEEGLGIRVREFAYPFGQYDRAIAEQVEAAGYTSGRGDFWSGQQSRSKLYGLSAINAPTTLAQFIRQFP